MKESADTFTFTGIGTEWNILTDDPLTKEARAEVLELIRVFNAQFSRFVSDSEATALRSVEAGDYSISEEFSRLLTRADELRRLTEGLYDPAVGELLELAGYDSVYSMTPRPEAKEFVLPRWSLAGNLLTLDRGAVFDLGGMGKGYCIDRVAEVIESHGLMHYLVDAGGDMYGTTKKGGEPWQIAIEYPGKSDMAAGTVALEREGIAVSDGFRRRWAGWHHLVDPHLRAPIERVIGAVAVAANAWDADSATSALFFASEDRYAAIGEAFGARYLVFRSDGTTVVSADWKGELFV